MKSRIQVEVPFVFTSNGNDFIFHDKTNPAILESQIQLSDFPTPEQLWQKYCKFRGFTAAQLPLNTQSYHDDGSGKTPRYYQLQAINKTIEAVSEGKKRILFLADRNILVDQTRTNDFQPFSQTMTKVTGRTVDPAFEIHLALYQALTGPEENQKAYNSMFQFLIVAFVKC